ncbi:retrovirus-related pol polyprotein from transposon TNT 1-94 [Tanacetum coccineum]
MHNNIIAAGSRDHPPMLATGRYAQWSLHSFTVIILAAPATDDTPAVPERTAVETILNMSPENKGHYELEKEAIHLLLTGIGDEIHSTVDACKTAHEMWTTIERLQQGESLNIQDVKTNLFWEFGKFTSHDEESMESYYSRFYKMMNEMIRNNLTVATMQVNVQFLQQLQPEWSRIAKNANPLALVAAASPYPDPYYQVPKSHKQYAPTPKHSSSTRSNASTKFKGKRIAKLITPLSESASEEDSDLEQAQRDKDMQKNLALIAKYFKKIYKPTNNNIKTSSNFRNKNVDTSLRYKNENQTRKFRNQRTVTIARARETIGSQVVQQTGIQCFNFKEFSYFAKECRKPKRVKDSTYHKEKILLCKQTEKGVPLQAEKSDWLADTDEEIKEQELEAHYNYMAKIQEVPTADSGTDSEPLQQVDINVIPDSPDICDNDIQTDQNVEDERATLANLKLDVDENKKIQKQLKKANTSLAHELKECKSILAETCRTLGESNIVKEKHDELVKHSLLTKLHYEGLVKEKKKVITDLKLKEEKDINKMISMEKQLKFLNEIVYKRNQSIQTIHMLAPKGRTFKGRPTFADPMYLKKAQSEKPCLYEIPYDTSDPANRLIPAREETQPLEKESHLKLNKDLVKPYDYTKLNSLYEIFKPATQEYHEQLAHANEVRKKMWRKSFVKSKPKIFKNIGFLPTSKSISKSRQAYNVMTNNINLFKELIDQTWEKHSHDHFRAQPAHDMEILIKTYAHTELQCLYLHKVKEYECLAQKLSKQTETVSKEVYTELLRSFAKLEKLAISLELALQQYLKAQLQDKNIAICELKKLIKKCKGKSEETKFDKPPVVRQPNAQRIPKPSVLGKPTPFSDSLERKSFSKTKSVPKTNVSEGTVYFGNDQFAQILGYEDLVQGNIKINKVYYVEGHNHNLFSVGQFCDADLEVAFWKSTCFVRDLQGNDLLTGNRGSDLHIISLQETSLSTPICFMAKATPTQAWLWHRILSHLNFDYINLLSKKDVVIGLPKLIYVKDQLCSFCEVSKAKRSSFKTKVVPSSKGRLNLLHIDLCGPMRVASIIGKKYILAARKMLSASKLPLFFWDKAIATACYTQNGSIIIPTHEKMAYHIINDRKPSIKHLHIFGCTCYLTKDGENLDKIKEKGDMCILVGYSTQSKGYCTLSVNKSSSPTDNSKQQDTPPTMNIQSSTKPTTPTINVHAEENNDNQEEDT